MRPPSHHVNPRVTASLSRLTVRGSGWRFRGRGLTMGRVSLRPNEEGSTVPRRRVTLLDVAARAGVSRTTASFVLTGRRDMRISDDAEKRVLQAARELDYRPNLLARSLRTNLSQ